MSDSRKHHPFDSLWEKAHPDGQQQYAALFEESKVAFTVRRLCLNKQLCQELDTMEFQRTGTQRTISTFATFNSRFPSFPVVLSANWLNGVKLHNRADCVHPKWFQSFSRLPFFRPFVELVRVAEANREVRPQGMVFPRKGIMHGLIVHNADSQTYSEKCRSMHVYRGDGIDLVVQPFSGFLDSILASRLWTPQ